MSPPLHAGPPRPALPSSRAPRAPGPAPRPFVRLAVALVLLSPLGAALARLGQSETDRALAAVGEPRTRPDEARRVPSRHATGAPRPLLGFALNCHHIGDLPLYLESVDRIAEMGANTLLVVTPMYQRQVDSTRIRPLRAKCPTDEQLAAILRRAKQHGLYTALMPIVLIEKPRSKEWRGTIEPDDWDAWWDSYAVGLERFARLAARSDVDLLSIGSELNTTEHQVERWRSLAGAVRAIFPGRLTYSANWDRYEHVDLWPIVDVMSVSAYFELERDRPGAPEADLVRAWRPVQHKLLAVAAAWDKPLLLSEVGYPSLPWANAFPWNYVPEDGQRADHDAQARSWSAFLAAWRDAVLDPNGDLLGFCGYRWDPYHRGDERDTGYGVLGKPAHAIVRRGFAELGKNP